MAVAKVLLVHLMNAEQHWVAANLSTKPISLSYWARKLVLVSLSHIESTW